MFTVVAFCAAWNGGGVVVSCSSDQHLGTGWFATSPRRRFAHKDLAWDYPGVKVQGECLLLFNVIVRSTLSA